MSVEQEGDQASKQVSQIDEDIREEDILRILITSDNHLGYCERDSIRRDDSFITFEEILQIANEKKVHTLFRSPLLNTQLG